MVKSGIILRSRYIKNLQNDTLYLPFTRTCSRRKNGRFNKNGVRHIYFLLMEFFFFFVISRQRSWYSKVYIARVILTCLLLSGQDIKCFENAVNTVRVQVIAYMRAVKIVLMGWCVHMIISTADIYTTIILFLTEVEITKEINACVEWNCSLCHVEHYKQRRWSATFIAFYNNYTRSVWRTTTTLRNKKKKKTNEVQEYNSAFYSVLSCAHHRTICSKMQFFFALPDFFYSFLCFWVIVHRQTFFGEEYWEKNACCAYTVWKLWTLSPSSSSIYS